MTTSPVDEVLAALAEPSRRLLLDRLAMAGEATATNLAADLPLTRQAVVKHLGVLAHAGLVSGNRVGREVFYRVRSQPLDVTARWMMAMAAKWDGHLATIKHLAEKPVRHR
jgi:DNA-binding transcriptional ArsR family regulator